MATYDGDLAPDTVLTLDGLALVRVLGVQDGTVSWRGTGRWDRGPQETAEGEFRGRVEVPAPPPMPDPPVWS